MSASGRLELDSDCVVMAIPIQMATHISALAHENMPAPEGRRNKGKGRHAHECIYELK